MKSLSDSEVHSKLSEIPGWSVNQRKLHRKFEFKNFVEAFGFMSQAALVAEKMDHHPEWSNVYNRVTVDLTTHDANGITERDFKLAQALNQISAKI